MASVTAVRKLDAEGDGFRVERQTEAGYDVLRAPTPTLITVTAGATEPRYPSLKGIMAAKSKPVERLNASDLGVATTSRPTQSVAGRDGRPGEGGRRDRDGGRRRSDGSRISWREAKVI